MIMFSSSFAEMSVCTNLSSGFVSIRRKGVDSFGCYVYVLAAQDLRPSLLSAFRQLRYLPIRIAVAMDARQNRRMERDSAKGKSSAISILAARIAAKEEDEARHSLPIEKVCIRSFGQDICSLEYFVQKQCEVIRVNSGVRDSPLIFFCLLGIIALQ